MIVQHDWDTIAAISTPWGESGIGIVRVSGPKAKKLGTRLFRAKKESKTLHSHRVYYGELVDPVERSVIDEVLLLFMARPRTYTREDVLEIHCHGGYLVLRRVLECLLREGARLAEPGEFTKRAFLNGRIDLTQAEAVIETIKARTPGGLRLANEQLRGRLSGEIFEIKRLLLTVLAEMEGRLDFPEEDLGELNSDWIWKDIERASQWLGQLVASFEDGIILRDGAVVAIVGKTNVGKSSLLNALLGDERAIVTDVAGTTRDVIEETMSLSGVQLRVMDTAGVRKWRNVVEREGIRRMESKVGESDLVLLVLDRSRRLGVQDEQILSLVETKKKIVVLNKMDLCAKLDKKAVESIFPGAPMVEVSARTGEGLERLKEWVGEFAGSIGMREPGDETVVMETRHRCLLERAFEAVGKAKEAAGRGDSPEILSLEIRAALGELAEIVGETVSEDVLGAIFSRFCVGK